MALEDEIRKIMAEAADKIIDVVRNDSGVVSKRASSIENTANKVLLDLFAAKTFLVGPDTIDKERLGMLDYMHNTDVEELYSSCFKYYTTGIIDERYKRFCDDISQIFGTDSKEEMDKYVDIIIYKHKGLK